MKSSKWMIGLLAVALVIALAPSSFAQVQIQAFNTASAGEIQTNRNAQTSDPTSIGSGILISGQLIANSPLTTTTLTLTFPGPITSAGNCDATLGTACTPGIPSADPIQIQGSSGLFAGVTAVQTINFSKGTITIQLPGTLGWGGAGVNVSNSQSGTFRLIGVRIDVNGLTAPLTAGVSLSSSANNYIARLHRRSISLARWALESAASPRLQPEQAASIMVRS